MEKDSFRQYTTCLINDLCLLLDDPNEILKYTAIGLQIDRTNKGLLEKQSIAYQIHKGMEKKEQVRVKKKVKFSIALGVITVGYLIYKRLTVKA